MEMEFKKRNEEKKTCQVLGVSLWERVAKLEKQICFHCWQVDWKEDFKLTNKNGDLDLAIELGKKHNQISIYDLDNDCSIYLK